MKRFILRWLRRLILRHFTPLRCRITWRPADRVACFSVLSQPEWMRQTGTWVPGNQGSFVRSNKRPEWFVGTVRIYLRGSLPMFDDLEVPAFIVDPVGLQKAFNRTRAMLSILGGTLEVKIE